VHGCVFIERDYCIFAQRRMIFNRTVKDVSAEITVVKQKPIFGLIISKIAGCLVAVI